MKEMVRRTPYENVIDRFLLLYVIAESSERTFRFGKTKLQKYTFLSEWRMIDERKKGLNFNFIKLVHGPYSGELDSDLTDLAIYGLVSDPELQLTNMGHRILEDFSELLEQNKPIISTIDQVITRFGRYSLNRLLRYIYSLPHPYRKGITIGTTPFKTPLLYRLVEEKALSGFTISGEQLEDLILCLGKRELKAWREVRDEIQRGRHLKYQEVFRTVNR